MQVNYYNSVIKSIEKISVHVQRFVAVKQTLSKLRNFNKKKLDVCVTVHHFSTTM
jgi:hypothetical protein